MAEGWHGIEGDVFACPEEHCYYRVLMRNEESSKHSCPFRGQTTNGWSITMGLVEQIWGFLDESIDIVKSATATEEEKATAGIQARAFCKTLSLFTRPIFVTEDQIGKEGMARWRARQAGDDSYRTKGWLHSKYMTLMDGDVWYPSVTGDGYTSDPGFAFTDPYGLRPQNIENRQKALIKELKEDHPDEGVQLGFRAAELGYKPSTAAKRKAAAPAAPVLPLDLKTRKSIRDAIESGMFKVSDMAAPYGITEAQVRAILASKD